MSTVVAERTDSLGSLKVDSRISPALNNRRKRFSWTTPVFSREATLGHKEYTGTCETIKEIGAKSPRYDNDKKVLAGVSYGTETRRGSATSKISRALKFFRGFSKNSGASIDKTDRYSMTIDEKTAAILSRSIAESSIDSLDEHNSREITKDLLNQDLKSRSKGILDSSSQESDKTYCDEPEQLNSTATLNKSNTKKKTPAKSESSDTQSRYMVNETGEIVPVDAVSSLGSILKVTDFPINGNPVPESVKEMLANKNSGKPKNSMNTTKPRFSFKTQVPKKEKKFRFNEFVVIFETYAIDEYDRRMGFRLEDNLCNTASIKLELNEYKSEEMYVHPESRLNTHFLKV